MEEKYQELKKIVEDELKEASSDHDMSHVMRVYNMCLRLAKDDQDVDLDILRPAALLHDIARVKEDRDKSGKIDHAILGAEMSERILKDLSFPAEKIERIKDCIITHRFRSENEPKTKEAKILSDVDKLDVLGAIGVARSFIIAGTYGEKLYSDTPVNTYIKENFVGGKSNGRIKDVLKHTPNLEFETKFKYIPYRLYTQRAKEIAESRLNFMKSFFERLKDEIYDEL